MFDKKIKKPNDVFDEVTPPPTAPAPAAAPAPAPVVVKAAEPASKALESSHPDYGINKAIELMRMLPRCGPFFVRFRP